MAGYDLGFLDGDRKRHRGDWAFPIACGVATYLWVQRDRKKTQAILQQWEEQRAAIDLAHQQRCVDLANYHLSQGACEEMAAAWAVYTMNSDPEVQSVRIRYQMDPLTVDAEWLAQMAAIRRSEAPPPLPPQPNLRAIRDLLEPPPSARDAVPGIPAPQ